MSPTFCVRCGWDERSGDHPCHVCRQRPGTLRTMALAVEGQPFSVHETWACDECWAAVEQKAKEQADEAIAAVERKQAARRGGRDASYLCRECRAPFGTAHKMDCGQQHRDPWPAYLAALEEVAEAARGRSGSYTEAWDQLNTALAKLDKVKKP